MESTLPITKKRIEFKVLDKKIIEKDTFNTRMWVCHSFAVYIPMRETYFGRP